MLEHENLVSDSEYITLNHQTGDATTHIKTAALKQELNNLHETKQDVLTAGTGITIQDNVISATGGAAPVEGASVSIQELENYEFYAQKYVVTSGQQTLTTFSFQCYRAEHVLTGQIKEQLETFLPFGSVSSGALSISNDGTNIKLINSSPSRDVYQHASFTFYKETGGGVSPE